LPIRLERPEIRTSFNDRLQALQWLETEQTNLVAALRYAAYYDLHDLALALLEGTTFMFLRSRAERLEGMAVMLEAGRRWGDRATEVLVLTLRGEILTWLRRWDEARADLELAAELIRDLGNRERQASTLNALGLLFLAQERYLTAEQYLLEALPLSRGIDTRRWEAVVEGNLCRAYTGLGRYRDSLDHGERGLALRYQIGDLGGAAAALRALAWAWQGLGQHEKAIELCQKAIDLGREQPASDTLAEPLETMARSLRRMGRVAEADEYWHEAAALFDYYGLPHRAAEIRDRIIGVND
jgi:tetratricopeptide (TPR) repeat protein